MTGRGRRWFPLARVEPAPRRGAMLTASPKKPTLIDPLSGPTLALAGRVVMMDEAFTVKADAVVYIDRSIIVAVQDRGQPPPPGFADVAIVETNGTLFPGL